MSTTSALLGLPYLMPAQAQKHVTHNEALQRLDALTQLVVEEIGANTPPVTPIEGAVYALGTAPSGDWAGQAGQLAYRTDGGWLFLEPKEGWRAWDLAAGALRSYQSGAWLEGDFELQNLSGVGIGATSDTTNKLAVSSDAVLFNHNGAGHQVKLNKATVSDTASLLYQSGFTGHAEMGLTGDTDFHIKLSPDGSTWTEALVLDATSGLASGAAVQADALDLTAGRLARADYVYGPASVLGSVGMTAGVPNGAVIERGSNANGSYTRWADGTQICILNNQTFTEEASGVQLGAGSWTYPAAFASAPVVSPSYSSDVTDWVGTNTHRRVSCFGCDAGATTATDLRIYAVDGADFATGAQANAVGLMAVGSWV